MELRCPECGSKKLTQAGKRWRKRDNRRVKVQQYSCSNCGRMTTKPRRA